MQLFNTIIHKMQSPTVFGRLYRAGCLQLSLKASGSGTRCVYANDIRRHITLNYSIKQNRQSFQNLNYLRYYIETKDCCQDNIDEIPQHHVFAAGCLRNAFKERCLLECKDPAGPKSNQIGTKCPVPDRINSHPVETLAHSLRSSLRISAKDGGIGLLFEPLTDATATATTQADKANEKTLPRAMKARKRASSPPLPASAQLVDLKAVDRTTATKQNTSAREDIPKDSASKGTITQQLRKHRVAWDLQDLKILATMKADGYQVSRIAAALGRTNNATRSYWYARRLPKIHPRRKIVAPGAFARENQKGTQDESEERTIEM